MLQKKTGLIMKQGEQKVGWIKIIIIIASKLTSKTHEMPVQY